MNRLIEAIKNGKVWNGYIITSNEITRAKDVADRMCSELGTNPYVLLEPKMEAVRKVIRDLFYDIQPSEYKVAIIYADNLSVICQNALLKTLEEPPCSSSIIFITTNISVLLPTVISRCVLYSCPDDENIFKQTNNMLATRYALGSLKRAKELMDDINFMKNRSRAIEIIKNYYDGMPSVILPNEKANIKEYLSYIQLFFRDVLLDDAYWFFDNQHLIKTFKNNFTTNQIISIIKYVNEKMVDINKNTNPLLVFDAVSFTILEVLNGHSNWS